MKVELTKEEVFSLRLAVLFYIKMNEKLTDKTIIEEELLKHLNLITNKLK
jgi:hypothetical protein